MKPIQYTGTNDGEILNAISHPQSSVRCQLGVMWLNGIPAVEGDWICQLEGRAYIIRERDWHLIEDEANRLAEIAADYYPRLRQLRDRADRYHTAMIDGYSTRNPTDELAEGAQ